MAGGLRGRVTPRPLTGATRGTRLLRGLAEAVIYPSREERPALGTGRQREGDTMRLNPPTIVIFLISLVLALLALFVKFGIGLIPTLFPHQGFWLAIVAYLVLMVGCLVKGL